ncbi:MAG: carbohydrate-binding protein [Prevotella sp.]|nr:carbohydrate-binding protein [Prevotella sp.]
MKKNITSKFAWAAAVAAAMSLAIPAGAQEFDIDEYQGIPFNGPHTIVAEEGASSVLLAEDFDTVEDGDAAAENITYYSQQAHNNENLRSTYRPEAIVRIADHPDFLNIGNTSTNDYLCYTIEVTEDADFYIDTRVSSGGTGKFQLFIDEKAVSGTVSFKQPEGMGWDDYQTVRVNGIHLTEGKHVFKWVQKGGMNLDKFIFIYAGDYLTKHEYDVHVPGYIPAYAYDEQLDEDIPTYSFAQLGAGDQKDFRLAGPDYNLGISGAGTDDNPYRVGNTTPGDWWQYTVTVDQEADDYVVRALITSAVEEAAFDIDIDYVSLTGGIEGGIPCYTGGWGFSDAKWFDVAENVSLSEGEAVVTFHVIGGLNLYGIDFSSETASTGVKDIKSERNTTGGFYTMGGVRVQTPTKGIYVYNGKKLVVK